ncbi:MAG: RNA-binding protein [Deltaproteobacteria bacterium]|nr:RNA-binding protein [Deltaproteobacteria bacterium]
MGKKLFVGNLSFNLSEESLEQFFSEVGKVESVKIVKDQRSGRSKGFGFVEMSSEEEAANAISDLNNRNLEGRNISVAEAKPQAPRDDRGGGRFDRGPR